MTLYFMNEIFTYLALVGYKSNFETLTANTYQADELTRNGP